MSGRLALVFGPSGAGKDTLLLAAAETLDGRPGLRFVRRVITRPSRAGDEQNEAVDEATFLHRRAAGAFALHWSAHGLHYGIPADIAGDLAAGTTVVASVSRTVLAEAVTRFPVCLIEITAPVALRATRLAARERETEAAVAARLAREVPLDAGMACIRIYNDRDVASGAAALRDSLLVACDVAHGGED